MLKCNQSTVYQTVYAVVGLCGRTNQRSIRERGWRESRGFRGKSAGIRTDVAGIPRGWKWELRGSRVDRICYFAGTPRGCFRNPADDNKSGESVRMLGKLCREIYYVAAKYVPDSWSTVFWSCCKK